MYGLTFDHTFENIKRCSHYPLYLLVTEICIKWEETAAEPLSSFAKACAKTGE